MKCISLWQPWASLIAIGAKRIETRSWPISYRGPLLIHAAKKWDKELAHLCWREPFRSYLHPHGLLERMPRGVIVCRCELHGCVQVSELARTIPDEPERSFGDYSEGRFAWLLRDAEPFEKPVPYRGMQGLFDVPITQIATLAGPAETPGGRP